MPKLRSVRTPTVTEMVIPLPRSREFNFKKGHKKLGGRERGVPNVVTRSTRESILEGLTVAGNTMGRDGIVSYVVQAALADFRNGIALLGMVTPRSADVQVTHAPAPVTLEQLDDELQRMGLPKSSEIFQLDFKGSDAVVDAYEAEVVEK